VNKTAEHPPALESRTGRILVADDEERNRRLLCVLLEAEGHAITLAEDGQQALQKASASRPDVILLDVMMPKMDGLEVCRRLKADPMTAFIPILIVTAFADRADRIKAVDAGADDFLTKPIDREELVLRIRNALYRKHLYDVLAEKYAELKAMAELRESLTSMLDADTEVLSSLMRPPAQEDRVADRMTGTAGNPQKGGEHGAS
jgi:CheY-like chemotaxis protein